MDTIEYLDAGTNAIRENAVLDMYEECELEIVNLIMRGEHPDFFADYACEVAEATIVALKAYNDGPKDADILAGALSRALELQAQKYAEDHVRWVDGRGSMEDLCRELGIEFTP